MIINITHHDIWQEFVYYRTKGHRMAAFDHLRRYRTQEEWESIVAGIASRRYKVNIGDVITVTNADIQFVWDTLLHDIFALHE